MELKATKRTETGTSASKKARAEGKVPAAIYGKETETVPVLLNQKELENTLREVGANGVFDVNVDGEVYHVFVKEQEKAAIKPILYHVDLLSFTKGQKVHMTIPVYITGEDDIKEGYVSQSISELEVEVAPAEAPSEYTVDVSSLTIGDTVSVSEIQVGNEVTLLTDPESTVVSISAPDAVEEETVETSDDMPEPEVIGDNNEESDSE